MTYFPLVWYPALAGGSYLLYEYYIHSERQLFEDIMPGSSLNAIREILLASGMYLTYEMIQFVRSKVFRPSPMSSPDHPFQNNENAHVIIAAHNAYDSLKNILPSVLAAFPAHHIWVADNGLTRDDATQVLSQELGIQYRYYPEPNKTLALYKTAEEIYDTCHSNVSSLVLLDDDTQLPEGFFVRHDLLDQPLVAGYCVGISIDKSPPFNVLEHLIDFEYKSISYRNECKAYYGTIPFLHGICAVYNVKRMLMIYSKLCTLPGGLPFGEDSFAGIDCRVAGYRLLQDNLNVVSTFCPRRIFPSLFHQGREQGFGASSLWKQRTLRWYLSWPRRLPSEIALAFFYDAGSWVGNVLYRLDLFWYLILISVSSLWPLYMARIGIAHHSWALLGYLHASLYGVAVATASMRFAAFPESLKEGVDRRILLLVPAFNILVCFFMACSFFLSMFWYIPFRRISYQKCYESAW